MLPKLILLQFSAHLLADFVFQDQQMSDGKSKKIFTSYHIVHFFIVGGLSLVFAMNFGFWLAALSIASLHLLTDILKSWLTIRAKGKGFFFADQFIHLVIILIITWLYTEWAIWIPWFEVPVKTVALIAGFILCTRPSNILIRHLFVAFDIQTPGESTAHAEDISLPNAGKLIGIVERLLALSLILLGQYEAVGLVLAAKSILRFSGPQKSEYVLVGTLLSFGIAAFCGFLINLL